jgi:hypothetical protein
MVDRQHNRLGSWTAVVVLTVLLILLVLTFPYQGVGSCSSDATFSTGVGGCNQYLLSWHGGVKFPDWQWLPLAYVAAILGTAVGLVLALRGALRSR